MRTPNSIKRTSLYWTLTDLDGKTVLGRGGARAVRFAPLVAVLLEDGAHGLEPLVGQPEEEVREGLHGHRRVDDLGVYRGHLRRIFIQRVLAIQGQRVNRRYDR